MKFKDWLFYWLRAIKPKIKAQTRKKYEINIRIHIVSALGEYKLDELSADVLEDYALKLCYSNLAANTVIGILVIVAHALKRAVQMGKVKEHFADALIYPKANEKPVECFNKSEQKKIENYVLKANKPKLLGIIISLYTGLRIGELLALTWTDIDFSKKTLTITKSCYDSWENGKYKKVIDTPKTDSAVRVIPLPVQLISILRELKKKNLCPYVVCGKTSEGSQIRSYQTTFETLLKKLNIAHKGFHSLRHTFATRAMECNMDVKTLSELLGHKNPLTTLKRYAHSLIDHKILMMNKVGKLLQVQ
ncbi:MAG: site-specific integrase [Anaeroplasma bactoclasticum]|nr:site-specific integrase [Anaeroplasma bactoclasticum]